MNHFPLGSHDLHSNCVHFLRGAIQSAVVQTLDTRLIVEHDGSPGNSREIHWPVRQ